MPWPTGPPDTRTKLDDLAPPDDSTRLDASTRRHGLMPKLTGDPTQFLGGDGRFSTPGGGALTVVDATFSIQDDVTPSKIAQFQCSGISAATTRTFTFPNSSGTLALIDLAQSWSALQTFLDTTFRLADNTTPTKIVEFQLSGLTAGTNVFTFPNTAAGTFAMIDLAQTFTQRQTIDQAAVGGAGLVLTDSSGVLIPSLRFSYQGFPSPFTVDLIPALGVGGTVTLPDGTYTLAGLSLAQKFTAAQTFGVSIKLEDPGAGTNAITLVAPSTPTSHTLTLPGTQGAASTLLTNDGSGNLSWATNAATVDVARTWATLQKFPDDKLNVVGSGDATKIMRFEVDGITTGTTRTLTVANVSGTLPTLENPHTVTGAWVLGDGAVAITADTVPVNAFDGTGFRIRDVVSGFSMQLNLNAASGLTADRLVSFPDASAILVGTTATQTLNNKTLSVTGNLLKTSTAGSGVSFSDNGTASKRLWVVLSGAVGDNNFVISSTAARAYTFPNDDMTVVGQVGSSALTGQTASVGATTLRTTTHAGVYRISIYAVLTAVTIPGNLTLTALWTDPQQAQTLVVNRGGTIAYAAAGNIEDGSVTVRATSGSTIQFSTTLTGTATYSVYATCEVVTNS